LRFLSGCQPGLPGSFRRTGRSRVNAADRRSCPGERRLPCTTTRHKCRAEYRCAKRTVNGPHSQRSVAPSKSLINRRHGIEAACKAFHLTATHHSKDWTFA
jgi:hypothetical protein